MRWKMNKSMKWSWFKLVPVKVEQINEYLFSDTVRSQKTKSGSDEISQGQYRGYPSKCSLGQVQTKVVKKNGREKEEWKWRFGLHPDGRLRYGFLH